ncbi:TRAP transporter substrate-binding protein DctP [Roseomonas sp. ACRSG]|nr:TRAP transporter substrate-binding protein DctP [Roseomonas sp. ACRSG]
MTATRRGVMAAGAGLWLGAARPARAQTRWQAATPWLDGSGHTRNLRQFLDEVRQGTGGGLDIRLHAGGTLLKSAEMLRGLQTGRVQLGELLLALEAALDPILELDSLPMLVRSLEDARRLAGITRPLIEQRLRREGLTLLYLAPWSPAGLFSGFAVDTLEDLRGTRMRTMTPLAARLASLAGALAAHAEPEEPLSFSAPLATTMFAGASSGVDVEAWSFARFFMPLDISFPKDAVCAQSRAWEALAAQQRTAVLRAAAAAEERAWAMASSEGPAAQEVLVSHGVRLRPPSPRLLVELEQLGRIMLDEWRARAGETGARVLAELRAG